MRKIFRTFGMIMWIASGIFVFIFWFMAMTNWLGFLGSVLAIIICPGLIIFPIIFWIVEGIFPGMYFAIWGLGIVGIIIAGLSGGDEY